MAVQWGAAAGGSERVGIEVSSYPNDGAQTSHTVTVDYYVTVAGSINDNQTLTLQHSLNGTYNFLLKAGASGTTVHVARLSFIGYTSYGGGPGYTFGASISGHYAGATPGVTVTWSLPARPPLTPTPPPVGVDEITSSSARILVWPADGRGAGVDTYQTLVGTSGDIIGTQIYNWSGNGTNRPENLKPATNYYAAIRAHNAVGWSDWAYVNFRTAARISDAPAPPQISNIQPDAATISWSPPGYNGGAAILYYLIQTATNAAFTENVVTTDSGSSPVTRADLLPGRTYYARIGATNSAGGSPWSAATSFETLSGMRVKIGGSWRSAKVWAKKDGVWKVARVHKKVGGSWRL